MTEPEAPQKPAKAGIKRQKPQKNCKNDTETSKTGPSAGKPAGPGPERRGEYGLTTSRYVERAEGSRLWRLTDEGIALITSMYAYGSTQAEVAAILGVSVDVLQNSANREIDRHARELGSARWAQEIRVQQRTILREGDTKMAIWLGKQVLGQQDRIDVTATVSEVSDASELTYDEAIGLLEQVAGKRLRAEAKAAAREARRRASRP